MANVNSISNANSVSSLYGNRNVLSGLASGLDTEAMIENSISGYQTKIAQLEQKQTKVQWQQDSFRELIGMSNDLTAKYSSYTSSTNLMSAAFFNSASVTSTLGTYANMVTARGTSSSSIQINSVTQTAASATYGVSLNSVGKMNVPTTGESDAVNLSAAVAHNSHAGTYTLMTSAGTVDLTVPTDATYKDAYDLAALLNEKMKGATISLNGTDHALSDFFEVASDSEGSSVTFQAKSSSELNLLSTGYAEPGGQMALLTDNQMSVTTKTIGDDLAGYLEGRKLSVTVDGVSQTIALTNLSDPSEPVESMDDLAAYLGTKLSSAFGKDISVSYNSSSKEMQFAFENGGHSLSISALEGEPDYFQDFLNVDISPAVPEPATTMNTTLGDLPYTLNSGTINDVEVDLSGLTSDSTIQDVLKAINASNVGVTASYSKLTNQIFFTTKDTGSEQKIEFGGDLAGLFGTPAASGASYQAGKDAVVNMTINGQTMERTFSSNTIDMDGMQVTLKGTFTPDKAKGETGVTFGGSAESDKIVNAVKSFVEDYNNLFKSLRTAYATQPEKQSNGKGYEPLTEKDKSSMSESAIKSYEEKAKKGLLFGDNDLSSMYTKLLGQLSGSARTAMEEIGLSTSYKDGLTTLTLDENKLRNALESGTDKVKEVFTDSSYGANDGLVGRMKSVLDSYTSTSTAKQGILVRKAGTTLSSYSLTNNTLQKTIDNIQSQIEKWQIKMSSRVDYYTKQFSKLEQIMNTMNNQSSMLSGMMGG